jgi:hypothetical protein
LFSVPTVTDRDLGIADLIEGMGPAIWGLAHVHRDDWPRDTAVAADVARDSLVLWMRNHFGLYWEGVSPSGPVGSAVEALLKSEWSLWGPAEVWLCCVSELLAALLNLCSGPLGEGS